MWRGVGEQLRRRVTRNATPSRCGVLGFPLYHYTGCITAPANGGALLNPEGGLKFQARQQDAAPEFPKYVNYLSFLSNFVEWLGFGATEVFACIDKGSKPSLVTVRLSSVLLWLHIFSLIYADYCANPCMKLSPGTAVTQDIYISSLTQSRDTS